MPAVRHVSPNKKSHIDSSGRFKRELFMCSETDVGRARDVTAGNERIEQRSPSFSQTNGSRRHTVGSEVFSISNGSPPSGAQQQILPRSDPQIRESFKENIDSLDEGRVISLPTWMEQLNQARIFAGRIINNETVQLIILMMIVVNAVMMGVATFPVVEENDKMRDIFELADETFLIIFTVESGIQLLYHGWTLFKDGFLVVDLLIVVLSWALHGTNVIRAFRIFRALRLVTRVETMRKLVMALIAVFPKMAAIVSHALFAMLSTPTDEFRTGHAAPLDILHICCHVHDIVSGIV